jgi:hypothetical protein
MVRLLLQRFGIAAPSLYGKERPLETPLTRSLNKQPVDAPTVFWKTHELNAWPDCRGLLVLRDGRDTLVSYAHYLMDFEEHPGNFSDILSELCASTAWSTFYRYWCAREGVLSVRYEDLCVGEEAAVALLKKALYSVVGDVAEVASASSASFESLQSDNKKFFRRGVVGGWREEMSGEQAELFWCNHSNTMIALGYTR